MQKHPTNQRQGFFVSLINLLSVRLIQVFCHWRFDVIRAPKRAGLPAEQNLALTQPSFSWLWTEVWRFAAFRAQVRGRLNSLSWASVGKRGEFCGKTSLVHQRFSALSFCFVSNKCFLLLFLFVFSFLIIFLKKGFGLQLSGLGVSQRLDRGR